MLGCPCHSSQVPTNSPEPTPIPNLEDRASHQKSQNWKEIAQLHFRVAWNLWPLDFFQFTPLDTGMYILGLSYHYALEADNLLSGFEFHRFTVVAVQWLSHVQLFATPWNAACQASLSSPHLMESAQTHVHWVDDAIQQSQPLSLSPPTALKFSQHQGLSQWVGSSHQMARV